jgi:arsenate reductase (thioredoxin)
MKKRILFVCVGNAIRSQMAEAFARKHGADIVEPLSAGLAAFGKIMPNTYTVMNEKEVSLEGQYSKSLYDVPLQGVDRIVNISGEPLLGPLQRLAIDWPVPDPVGKSVGEFRKTRDDIEQRVLGLLHDLRS